MATISTSQTLDSAARSAGEAFTIDTGAVFTIDTDTRYHKNAPASGTGTLGAITMTDVTGGELLIDGRNVRWLAFTSGSGNVPAFDSVVSGSTARANLAGIYTAINVPPVAVGGGIPATGFLKLRSITSGSFVASETISGSAGANSFTAITNGVDVTGWIEVIKDDITDITIARAQKFTVKSEWFYLDNTSGSSQVIRLPSCSSGSGFVYPGVWIETSGSSGDYEFWPAQRYGASVASGWYTTAKGTDNRSKFVEMRDGGAIRIGANDSGAYGYIPAAGLKVRIPNVLMMSCATASRGSNSFPNATVASRPEFVTIDAGNIDIQGCLSTWYFDFVQPYSVTIKNTAITDNFILQECATAFKLSEFHTGNYLNTDINNATFTSNLAGGTANKCKWGRCGTRAASDYVVAITYCNDLTFTDCWLEGRIYRTNAGSHNIYVASCDNVDFIRPILVGGSLLITIATNCYIEDPVYADSYNTTSGSSNAPVGVIQLTAGSMDCVVKGGSWWPGIDNMNIDTAFLYTINATNIRWHTCGTPTTPISGGVSNAMLLAINDGGSCTGIELKRIYFNNLGTRFLTTINSTKGLVIENCSGNYGTNTTNDALDGITKGFAISAADTAFTSVYGTIFYNIFTSGTVGRVGLVFNEDTSTYASYVNKTGLTGASGFSSSGRLYLYNIGNVIEYEFPYDILGYTSFSASNVYVAGGNTGNLAVKYKLNTGSGWDASWIAATSGNLSGKSITASTGFKLKIQISCVTGGANYLNELYFIMATDATSQNTLYPLDIYTISFIGLVAGSEIRAYLGTDPTTAVELDSIESSGTEYSFTYPNTTIGNGYLVIFSLGYLPIRLPITYNNANQSFLIRQVVDRQYANPT